MAPHRRTRPVKNEKSHLREGMRILSGTELMDKPVPNITFFWGDLLRTKGRLTVIGAPKIAKSFFVVQLGLHIATGTRFLGMDTKQGVVLYVNFEISQEKLQERVQDLCAELDISQPDDFLTVTVNGGLALEDRDGHQVLEDVIKEVEERCGGLDVLILDPRRMTMSGDENQSEVLTEWCSNLDQLRSAHNFALVIVHHKGKGTKGAGRGSSVFDAWLDTILLLNPSSKGNWEHDTESTPNLKVTKLTIQGRDTEQRDQWAEFSYPTWRLTKQQEDADRSKVKDAESCVLKLLGQLGDTPLNELKLLVLKSSHSDYAFQTAVARLRKQGEVKVNQDKSKQGNWKTIRLVSPVK